MLRAVAEFISAQQQLRWATVPEQSGPKSGSGSCCTPFWGSWVPSNLTQCGLGRGLSPSNRLTSIHQHRRQRGQTTIVYKRSPQNKAYYLSKQNSQLLVMMLVGLFCHSAHRVQSAKSLIWMSTMSDKSSSSATHEATSVQHSRLSVPTECVSRAFLTRPC